MSPGVISAYRAPARGMTMIRLPVAMTGLEVRAEEPARRY
jgi:hypothetical protein